MAMAKKSSGKGAKKTTKPPAKPAGYAQQAP